MLCGAQGVSGLALTVYVFYRSMPLFLVLLPACLAYPLLLRGTLKKKRLEILRLQFKDAILAVASGLNAGYSVENSFALALKEAERVYGSGAMICEEIRLLLAKVRMNGTFDEALEDFAERSGIDDIRSFAEVFLAARKSGGELMKIISKTAEIIGEKIRIREDILTATASRRMEQKLMSAMPALIVFYIDFSSPGFFDVLYETAPGRLLMTACLAVFLTAVWMAGKILEIEV